MRVTITKSPGVFNSYGILMPTGSIQTVTDDFGKSLVFSLQATDTDGILTVAPNPPFEAGASQLPGIYTVATLPAAASYQAGTQAYTTDSQMMVSTNRGWLAAAPAVISIAQQRAKRIAAFNLGAAIAAPAWVAATPYVAGNCVTVPTGQVLICTTAGTSAGTAPAYSATQLTGRPIVDNTVTWYGVYQINGAASSTLAPTVTLSASAAAAGLTETQLRSGTIPDSRLTCFGGTMFASGFQNALAPFTFASGPSTGSGNATTIATGNGYSNAFVYTNFDSVFEFYITDSVVGLTFVASTSFQSIEIDGVLMQGAPQLLNGTAGQCLKFDYNGIVKRRLVCIAGNTPAGSNALRGVALSTIGFIERTDTLNDQMLLLGDSILNTISTPDPVTPIKYVGALLKRYLGLAGTINCSVGGSGYIAKLANTFNSLDILSNSVNQTLFQGYNPGHVMISQGINDIGQALATEQAAALATWQAIRALFPSAKITVTDGFSQANGPSAGALAQAAALTAQFTAWGDPNSRLVASTGTAANKAWIQGTANASSALALGNSCVYVGSDTVHPTPLGANYEAFRLASEISTAWNGAY